MEKGIANMWSKHKCTINFQNILVSAINKCIHSSEAHLIMKTCLIVLKPSPATKQMHAKMSSEKSGITNCTQTNFTELFKGLK